MWIIGADSSRLLPALSPWTIVGDYHVGFAHIRAHEWRIQANDTTHGGS